MKDRFVNFTWRGRPARAWLPDPLARRSFELAAASARLSERGLGELRLMEQRLAVGVEPIGRLLLRSEGIASSAIEGLRVPVKELVAVESIGTGGPTPTWVAANLAVVADAVAAADRELGEADLHEWHRRLMADSPLDRELHGVWRPSPGWIGGSSPLDAVYVPPLPDAIPDLMADLIAYANSSRVDPITQAAVAHAQFETIHPYGDGNGRVGRVLIGWILRRRGAVVSYPPPVSVMILRDAGGYLSGLYEFRQGDPTRWIDWFAERTVSAAIGAGELFGLVGELLADWRRRLRDVRSDSTAHCAARVLPTYPVISAALVATECDVSPRAALNGVELLAAKGILDEFTPPVHSKGRPTRWWIAGELVETVQRWLG